MDARPIQADRDRKNRQSYSHQFYAADSHANQSNHTPHPHAIENASRRFSPDFRKVLGRQEWRPRVAFPGVKIQKLAVLAVVIAGLLAYHNSFRGPFVFDDVPSISENQTIRHLWPPWKALSARHGNESTVEGRPVLNLTFAINYAFGGTAPWGYHVVNLAIHILAALTLFGVARRTLRQPVIAKRFEADATSLALAIAVIWMVHPLATEGVTYIVQRAESLMGLFYLLTLYGFIRGVESRRPGWWYALSVTACLLGMATKEVMVSAPLMVLLYDRTFIAGSFPQAWKQRWQLYVGLASTWVVLGYLVASVGSHGGMGFGSGLAWWQYALIQCRAIVHYLKLSVWPYPLIFDYGTLTLGHVGRILPYALVLAALATGTAIALWRRPAVGFLGVWFFAILAPSSSVVPLTTQTMAEHRMYLPLVAVVVVAVLGIYTLIGRWSLLVFLALAMGLGSMTWRRNEDYRSAVALWGDTIRKYPSNVRAYVSLGAVLFSAGRTQEAIGEYIQALRIDPDYAEAHNNLGITLFAAGNVQEGLRHFEKSVQLRPQWAMAQYNLGFALDQIGQGPEAIGCYERALQLDPDNSQAHYYLGIALARSGKLEDAVAQYREALRIDPTYADTHLNMGLALEKLGKRDEAIAQYEQALKLQPDSAPARNALARPEAGQ
jgi:Flp pilus assembly protein TadD